MLTTIYPKIPVTIMNFDTLIKVSSKLSVLLFFNFLIKMDTKMIVNKNILGLLEYLHRTIEAMTMVPRTDGTSARELNIYTSVKIVFEDRTPGC